MIEAVLDCLAKFSCFYYWLNITLIPLSFYLFEFGLALGMIVLINAIALVAKEGIWP